MQSGTRLGRFTIVSSLGRGGMGEVWRARDAELGRDVAVKLLPAGFADDAERVARFRREARILAGLSHPNIAAIHGLETQDDTTALVLELVEGPTLAERIAAGPVPLDETLEIMGQLIAALAAAHEAGVVHRDLKPANVKLRPDGLLKLLDFGLARSEHAPPEGDPSRSPTITAGPTRSGVLLGTAAYMAPEQVRGRPADRRSDVWALGVILYELLSGRRAFAGEDISDTLAAVLRDDPDPAALPPELPAGVRQALTLCLEKDPTRRVGDVATIQLALEGALASPEARPVEAARPVVRATIGLPPGIRLPGPRQALASPLEITPDGSRIVFLGRQGTVRQLYSRSIDELEVRPIDGTRDARSFALSPDGCWLAFHRHPPGVVCKVPIEGGTPRELAKISGIFELCWGEDGAIVFGPFEEGLAVLREGREPERITRGEPGREHFRPRLVPGGRAVVFTTRQVGAIVPNPGDRMGVVSLVRPEQRALSPGHAARVTSSGRLFFASARDDAVWAAPFELQHLTLGGEPVPVLEDVQRGVDGDLQLAVAEDGSLVYLRDRDAGHSRPALVDSLGEAAPLDLAPAAYHQPRLSPDGERLAVGRGGRSLFVCDLVRGTSTEIASHDYVGMSIWNPDGHEVVYVAGDGGIPALHRIRADGSQAPERLPGPVRSVLFPTSWSARGPLLCYEAVGVRGVGLCSVILDGEARIERLDLGERATHPALSPDGRWLAYDAAVAEGRPGIFVRPFPDVNGGRTLVAADGGVHPRWRSDGRELFYWSEDSGIVAVPVEADGDRLELGTPRALFGSDPYLSNPGRNYDVAPGGERFVLLAREGEPTEIVWVQNWLSELERLVPAG